MPSTKPPRLSLRPSDASRWTTCTESSIFIANNAELLPEDTSFYAEEGVKAHELAASLLLLGSNMADDYPNVQMMRHVESYGQFVRDERDLHNPEEEQLVESKVDLFYMPGRHGFIDAAHVSSRRVQIVDLKYGEGVAVFAFQNKQLAIYARSLVEMLRGTYRFTNTTEVEIIIFQPRCREGLPVSRWKMTLKELVDFTNGIADTAQTIQAVFAGSTRHTVEFSPSEDACRFCPAIGFCKSHAEWLAGDMDILDALENGDEIQLEEDSAEFLLGEPLDTLPSGMLPSLDRLHPEWRVKILRKKKAITRWLEKLEDYTFDRLTHGHREDAPGLKLVHGKAGNRYWNDPEAAERLLARKLSKEERMKAPEVISPTDAEKLLKGLDLSKQFQTKLAELTSRKSATMTMVDEDDPRPEVSPHVQPELEFEVLDVESELLDDIASDMLA